MKVPSGLIVPPSFSKLLVISLKSPILQSMKLSVASKTSNFVSSFQKRAKPPAPWPWGETRKLLE
ncbi:unnamed protein product [Arabis nemorensis]|uniref:Uncharacterized protein n=1 Tax=Arabis nemorensis TaxID=586526 RepID=A0A565AMN9_9BRAS|nr:unnamed protein product [Arabis nemorensis]